LKLSIKFGGAVIGVEEAETLQNRRKTRDAAALDAENGFDEISIEDRRSFGAD
jgi:hypothetical protein